MATTTDEAELGKKDVISPTSGKYYVRYVWVIDGTGLPVRVRVRKSFT